MYRQHGDILIHLVNLNTQGFEPGYAERVFDISPVKIHMTSQRSYRLATQSDVEGVKIWNTESGFTVNIPCLKEQDHHAIAGVCPGDGVMVLIVLKMSLRFAAVRK